MPTSRCSKGAADDIRTCDTGGLTTASWAACNGHIHVGRWRLEHGCFGEEFDNLSSDSTSAQRVAVFASCCAANNGDHTVQLACEVGSGTVVLEGKEKVDLNRSIVQISDCISFAENSRDSGSVYGFTIVLPFMALRRYNHGARARPGVISLPSSRGVHWPSSSLTAPGGEWATAVSHEEGSALGALSGCPGLRQHVAAYIGVSIGRVLRYVRGFEAEASALDLASHLLCSAFLVVAKQEGNCACS